MRTIFLACCLFATLVGCATTNMAVLGINDDKLKEKVAFDTSCPKEQIEIVDKREDQGSGDYKLKACGADKTYHRSGSVYYADGVDPLAGAK